MQTFPEGFAPQLNEKVLNALELISPKSFRKSITTPMYGGGTVEVHAKFSVGSEIVVRAKTDGTITAKRSTPLLSLERIRLINGAFDTIENIIEDEVGELLNA